MFKNLVLCLHDHVQISLRWLGLLVCLVLVLLGYLILPFDLLKTQDMILSHLLLSTELSISHLFLLELVIRLFEETTLLVNLQLIWVNICRNRDRIVNLVRGL